MPFKDPEKRAEYMRRYHATYRAEHADDIARRQAKWFQENKEEIITKQRRQRRGAMSEQAISAVIRFGHTTGQDTQTQ